jgi:lipopolysaccharide/colanic/teichoic acid biosynthesis glycosyltransferase
MLKISLDITLSIFILIFTLPFLLLIALVVWIDTSENPVYIQDRGITLNDKFMIYKFRTLRSNKNIVSNSVFYKREFNGLLTRTGKFLRTSGLDELPQLVNVLKGEMSLIGPRPLSHKDLLLLKKTEPEYYMRREKLNCKPGISGMWQIYGNRDKGAKNLIELDELYEKRKNLLLDLTLLLKTIPLIFTSNHSDSIVSQSNIEGVLPLRKIVNG